MSRKAKKFALDARFTKNAARWMGVGFEALVIIGLFCGIGYWLDTLEDTRPGWMILGFFVGFAVWMYNIIKRAINTKDDLEEADSEEDDSV